MADDIEVEENDLSAIIADEIRQAQTFDQSKRILAIEYMRGVMRDLPARGYLAQFVTQLFPEFVEIDGTIDVETNGGPVGAVGIRYDNDGGTVFTLTPVVALP